MEQKIASFTMKMEVQFGFHLVIFFLFLATLFTLTTTKWKQFTRNQKLPPGPWKLPFIGSLHHLIGSLPHHILRDLARKHGLLMHLQLGEISAVVVSSPRIAEEILKTHDLSFVSRPKALAFEIGSYNYKDVAFSPYGEYWRQMRKICVIELLSTKRVQSFESIRQEEGSRMIESIQQYLVGTYKPINLTEKISLYNSSMVCKAAFGKLCRDQETFVQLVKELDKLAGGFEVVDVFPSFKILHVLSGAKQKLLRIHHKIDAILENIINEHVEKRQQRSYDLNKEDLIDILLRIKESRDIQFPIANDNIKAVIFDMFGAGTETSSIVVEWALSEMMRNPLIMAKAQKEIREAFKGKAAIDEAGIEGLRYLKVVIKETLRLHPPSPLLLPRECREDCEIQGYKIPKKTTVIINIWAIGRDPEYWEDPDIFRPERFELDPIDFSGNQFQYIPFGAGRRMCPGVSFALANVELPLALLLYHFNWELPDGTNELDMKETIGIVAARKNNLYLVPTLYHPSFHLLS